MTRLQILISTKGSEGIKRIAAMPHPEIQGVEYVVSWQDADDDIPTELRKRSDFKIYPTATSGLSKNRNEALSKASADFALMADDDLTYSPEQLKAVIEAFEQHQDCTLLTFRYDSETPRNYPLNEFDLRYPPKGYYVCSVEIGLNLKRYRELSGRDYPEFDERFGLGAQFCAGEEELLVHSLLKEGNHIGRFIPTTCCFHPGLTTSEKKCHSAEFIEAKGSMIKLLKPKSWPLRMLVHAWRSKRAGGPGFSAYCRNWLHGVKALKRTEKRPTYTGIDS